MANDNLNFWCENASHLGATFYASGLDGKISDYSSFSIVVEQNGITIMEFVLLSSAATNPSSSGFSLEMYNDEHLGYNIFSPGCDYTAYLDCYRDDELYSISDGFDFSTPDITPPSSEDIKPDVFATVRDQGDYDTCVADSLACAMEIFKMRTASVDYEVYSTAYIYGTDNDGEEGMYNNEAIDNCYSHGSPRWEISTGTFPDSMWENEAAELFYDLKNDTTIYKHAKKQSFGQKASSCNVDFYDCDSVADAIETNGYFMFNFRIPDNFYDIDDSGIIPQPDEYTGVNHSMALIGLTTIDNKKYWIAQNSWGESWGDNGLCYVPYDWGCGVQSPLYKTASGNKSSEFDTSVTSWTTDCYAPSPGDGYSDYNDSSPYNIYAELAEDSPREVYLTWDSDVPDCKYFVLARQKGTDKWYTKAATTDTFVSVFVDEYDT